MHSSPNFSEVIKSRRMRYVGHGRDWQNFSLESFRKRLLRSSWEVYIKTDLTEIECGGVN